MATTVIFGDEADATVRGASAAYATARQVGTAIFAGGADSLQIGQRLVAGEYRIDQAIIAFDTRTIAGTITAAALDLKGSTDLSTQDFTIECRLHDWGATAESSDFVAGDDLASKTLLATFASSAFVSSYVTFTDVAMVANINRSDFTRMVVASDRQRTATTPTVDELVTFAPADNAGTTNDPKLTVTDSSATLTAVQGRMFHVIP